MNFITSGQNNTIKEIKALHQKKYRDAQQLYFIEGIRFVGDALENGQNIIKAVISDRLESLNGGSALLSKLSMVCGQIFCVPEKLFKEISDTQSPQGVLAVLTKQPPDMEAALENGKAVVILDSLQDPGNVGTIIRTADAAGISAVLMTKGCVDVYSPKVLRSTMGSVFHLPIIEDVDIIKSLEALREKGYKIIASHLKGENNYYEEDLTLRSAIIIGNEANGISEETAALSDKLVRIPMPGRAESLNASVAASIMIYEYVRQNNL